ncbi:proepiregulin [Lepisosteus oculatus]|uniref:Proepiregulin n=1 Tax=Lepisosteus oculatus TaxID=7918 RepID=W5N2H3_LEPOC|nr:PREDICTED: proepiregulin [Lepisosteus oculatus]
MTYYKAFLLLSFLGLQLLQHVQSTTPSPLCGPGQVECSTLVSVPQSYETPQIAQVKIQKCDADMDKYCFHGECIFLVDLNEHHCRCEKGFTGSRCAHIELVSKPLNKEYILLTVVCVGLLLIALAGTLYFFYKWYKKNKCTSREKKYQEVQLA